MGLTPGQPLLGQPIDVVFIGCCTNARLSDLRAAASRARRAQGRAERAGAGRARLAGSEEPGRGRGARRRVPRAGAEWREPGCSMCIAMNGDQLEPGQYAVSTSQPQLRGPAGQGRAHAARLAAHRRGDRRRRPRHRRPRAARALREGDDGPVHDAPRARGRAAGERHRHRPDHPGPLPQGHRQDRPRRQPVRRLALRRGRLGAARLRAQPARRERGGDPARRRQLRLRQLARARAVGARRLRLPRRDRTLVRRHLPQQLAQERPLARGGRR